MRLGPDNSLRKKAFKLFCQTGNKAEVARKLGVGAHLIYHWAKRDKWEECRKALAKQLEFHWDILQQAENDETLKLYLGELRFLDYLQRVVSEKILSGAVEPKTWRDILATQEFILREKRFILNEFSSKKKRAQAEANVMPERGELNDFNRYAIGETPRAGTD